MKGPRYILTGASRSVIHVWISQLAHALLPRTYHLMPIAEYILLECPIRAPHPGMVRSVPVFKSQVCKLEGQITNVSTNRSEWNVSYFFAIGYFVGYIAHKFVNSELKYWGLIGHFWQQVLASSDTYVRGNRASAGI
jgi:hypothetical protein